MLVGTGVPVLHIHLQMGTDGNLSVAFEGGRGTHCTCIYMEARAERACRYVRAAVSGGWAISYLPSKAHALELALLFKHTTCSCNS